MLRVQLDVVRPGERTEADDGAAGVDRSVVAPARGLTWWLKKKNRSNWKGEICLKLEIGRKLATRFGVPRQRSWRSILSGAARRKRWWLNSRRSKPL
jgi:hypothetical protein